jgi:hypothetical protein
MRKWLLFQDRRKELRKPQKTSTKISGKSVESVRVAPIEYMSHAISIVSNKSIVTYYKGASCPLSSHYNCKTE